MRGRPSIGLAHADIDCWCTKRRVEGGIMAFRRVAEMCEIYLQGRQQVQAGGAAARCRPQNLTDAGVAAGRRRPRAPLQGLHPLPLSQPAGA